MVTNRIFVAVSLFSFALFPFAARADVHVSTWAEFKDAVENGDGSTIYLDSNITADLNSPITTYAAGTVIDGQGFKLVGPEQVGDTKVNANFFNFTTDFSKDFAEEQRLKIQNLNLENGLRFSGSSYAYGGAIYNNGGTIGDISGDFSNNYALIEMEMTEVMPMVVLFIMIEVRLGILQGISPITTPNSNYLHLKKVLLMVVLLIITVRLGILQGISQTTTHNLNLLLFTVMLKVERFLILAQLAILQGISQITIQNLKHLLLKVALFIMVTIA